MIEFVRLYEMMPDKNCGRLDKAMLRLQQRWYMYGVVNGISILHVLYYISIFNFTCKVKCQKLIYLALKKCFCPEC